MSNETDGEDIIQFKKDFWGYAKELGQWKSLKCLN